MKTFAVSAHSLDCAACPRRYYMYRLLNKASAVESPARIQGIAGHGAVALYRRRKPIEDQERFIHFVFGQHELPPEDYRNPAYLCEALAQYRAEHQELETWDFEEVEERFDVVLGTVEDTEVHWTGRRDAVGVSRQDGHRWLLDNKFVSRDEGAEFKTATNSRALKGYCWAWNAVHPETPIFGVVLRRTVIRPPTKAKAFNFAYPLDPPIQFSAEILEEWRKGALAQVAQILRRHNGSPDEWPMEESCCRRTWGCCDYLEVCRLPVADRAVLLNSDAFRPADIKTDYELPTEE